MKVKVEDIEYEIIKNEREGFVEEDFINKCTDYYYSYDYVVGDWAYSKLRLKGFYDAQNKKVKNYNNIEKVEEYIDRNCAYGCKYFIAKKIS